MGTPERDRRARDEAATKARTDQDRRDSDELLQRISAESGEDEGGIRSSRDDDNVVGAFLRNVRSTLALFRPEHGVTSAVQAEHITGASIAQFVRTLTQRSGKPSGSASTASSGLGQITARIGNALQGIPALRMGSKARMGSLKVDAAGAKYAQMDLPNKGPGTGPEHAS